MICPICQKEVYAESDGVFRCDSPKYHQPYLTYEERRATYHFRHDPEKSSMLSISHFNINIKLQLKTTNISYYNDEDNYIEIIIPKIFELDQVISKDKIEKILKIYGSLA